MSEQESVCDTGVAIVGAGPIGLELAAALRWAGFDYVHFDAHQIGHTFTWWPRNTYFFSTSERIAIAGIPIQTTTQQRITGEEYLAYLRAVVEQLDLPVRTYERVAGIERRERRFLLHTRSAPGERHYTCNHVVLATGDMHGPNLLGIPGEELPHVSHFFDNVHPYFRRDLLIVGGRNSAVEAALRCWRAGARVTLSYRRAEFDPDVIKHWLLPDLSTQIELGNIGFLPLTAPVAIEPGRAILERLAPDGAPTGEQLGQPADHVLLLTGFQGDIALFRAAGVTLEGPTLTPVYDEETMETNVPGVYVAGTAAAGQRQGRYTLFVENSHVHVARIVSHLTGRVPPKLGTVPARRYDLPLERFQDN
jgi:thioredoxin reductase (NADPH)